MYSWVGEKRKKHPHALQHLYSKSGQWVVICQWVSVLRVSISLCLNKLSITALALPVYLSHWPPLWRATGAECSGAAPRTSTHTASFKVKAKFTQSWASTGCPAVHCGCVCVCVLIRGLLPGPNIHTQREKKGRKTDRPERKRRGGMGGKQWSVITGIISLKSDSVVWKECGCVRVCRGICLMGTEHCAVSATE